MIHIKLKVDPNSVFTDLLSTFDHFPDQNKTALYNDLMHGRILHSDINAIMDRISTKDPINHINLGAKVLYYFFKFFKAIFLDRVL